ncbi:MAG: hypothetical protein AAFY41_15250, partial [Bacteroidota bacterium]
MNQQALIPSEQTQPPEHHVDVAVANVMSILHSAIQDEGLTLAGEWAEQFGYDDTNPFMEDRAREVIAQVINGYISKMAPKAHQFGDAYVSAYLGIEPA